MLEYESQKHKYNSILKKANTNIDNTQINYCVDNYEYKGLQQS